MEWLSSFAGTAGIPALITILILLLAVSVLAKLRIISFNGKGLRIGEDSVSAATRIKQLQWDFLQAETEIALRSLPPEYLEEPRKWRTHYVVGKYRDVLELALINNNIIDDETYIKSKQTLCYAAVLKATKDDYFKSNEFKLVLDKLTEKIIRQFYKIKKQFENL